MSMAPFGAHPPISPQSESRRTRLAVLIATLGICATLLAYGLSPGVRHAVSHAAHSVKGAVSRVFDRDAIAKRKQHIAPAGTSRSRSTTRPRRPAPAGPSSKRGATGAVTAPR
jgi:hypothetical protein